MEQGFHCGGIEAERLKLADFQRRNAEGLRQHCKEGVPCAAVIGEDVEEHGPAL